MFAKEIFPGCVPYISWTAFGSLSISINSGTATRGGVLLGCYSLGLGIPFLVVALAWRRALGALKVIRRHQKWVTRIGGAMFVVIGLALLTGWWEYAVQWLQIHLVDAWTPTV